MSNANFNEIIDTVNRSIINNSLTRTADDPIYSQVVSDYISNVLTDEDVWACYYYNTGDVAQLMECPAPSVMVARQAIPEMMSLLATVSNI